MRQQGEQNKTKRYKDEHFISKLMQLCRQRYFMQSAHYSWCSDKTCHITKRVELYNKYYTFLLIENKTWSKRWIAAYTFTPMQAFWYSSILPRILLVFSFAVSALCQQFSLLSLKINIITTAVFYRECFKMLCIFWNVSLYDTYC